MRKNKPINKWILLSVLIDDNDVDSLIDSIENLDGVIGVRKR